MTQPAKNRPGLAREFIDIITNVAPPYHEPPKVVLRRRIVVVVVLAAGSAVLGYALNRRPGDLAFDWLTFAAAALWMTGALVAGPMHLGVARFRGRNERPVFTGTGIGLVLGGVFVLGALLARQIPAVSDLITPVVEYANQGNLRLIVPIVMLNAIGEEMFFRSALYTALGRHQPLLISTVLYVGATLASGNLALGFAALIVGTVCGIERRATGGVLAPALTHLVWGLVMVLALPPIFGT